MIVDERHALYVGAVLALGMKHGLDLRAVDDGAGNWTDRIELVAPGPEASAAQRIRVELIVPPPPDGWRLADWVRPAIGTIPLERKDTG